MSDDDTFLLYGTRDREAESLALTAGPLSVTLQDGNLRTLRYRGHEVLRAIAFLVRDRDWGTCIADITGMDVESSADAFRILYRARYTAPDGAHLDCAIEISSSGRSIRFDADCIADADFLTARAGFSVLHPIIGLAGKPVTVTHTDGAIEQARWPDRIDPWQPFKEIAAITHRVTEGIVATTRFDGDTFEMEDQRNWTDASYKTYVRPLALPWPYRIRKGERFSQSITLDIDEQPGAHPAPQTSGGITLRLVPTERRFFEMGVGLRADCQAAEQPARELPASMGFRHLIAHFDPQAGDGLATLQGYAGVATASGLPVTLELALPCVRPPSEELAGFAALVDAAGLSLASLFVSPTVDRQSTPPGSTWPDCPPLEEIYAAARAAFPGIWLGGGMMSYFTELNRKRIPADAVDYVSHATNPIVHAADDLSVMQTFEALDAVVASTRAIYGDKPYRIGPSTIAMRQNPYGSATKDNPGLSRIPMANVDPRHNGQFGAAFALAYAATVAPAGLEVLTLSTLAGGFGLLAGEGEPAGKGELRPIGHVLARLSRLAGQAVVAVESARPEAVVGVASPDCLLLANITASPQEVVLPLLPKCIASIGPQPVEMPLGTQVTLPPYGCVDVTL